MAESAKKKGKLISQMVSSDSPSARFDLVKVNNYGKKQNRSLVITKAGVQNMSGKSCQWFLQSNDIYAMEQNPNNPTELVLKAFHRYTFEAKEESQMERILEAFKEMNLGLEYQRRQERLKQRQQLETSKSSTDEESSEKQRKSIAEATLADFKVLKLIGKGSFGRVLLVEHNVTKRLFAMKVLRKEQLFQREQVEHTKTEHEILAKYHHPFILNLYFSFQTDDRLFMVMDFINGGELFFHLGKVGRFPEQFARFYLAEILLALNFLHEHNIIYRDLKPENILLDSDGHVRLCDFGLAKTGISSMGGRGPGQQATTFCGTPEYLAPEIITNVGHGKAVDWWSLGILCFELLTGSPPFYSENLNEMYLSAVRLEISYPSHLSPISQDFMAKLLVRKPEDRLGSGREGIEEIKSHPFFNGINFESLEKKELSPPFKPVASESPLDLSNIDEAFTSEDPTVIDVDEEIDEAEGDSSMKRERDMAFKDFTFVQPEILN